MNDLTKMILTTVKTAVSDSDEMIATRKNEIYEAATNLYIFFGSKLQRNPQYFSLRVQNPKGCPRLKGDEFALKQLALGENQIFQNFQTTPNFQRLLNDKCEEIPAEADSDSDSDLEKPKPKPSRCSSSSRPGNSLMISETIGKRKRKEVVRYKLDEKVAKRTRKRKEAKSAKESYCDSDDDILAWNSNDRAVLKHLKPVTDQLKDIIIGVVNDFKLGNDEITKKITPVLSKISVTKNLKKSQAAALMKKQNKLRQNMFEKLKEKAKQKFNNMLDDYYELFNEYPKGSKEEEEEKGEEEEEEKDEEKDEEEEEEEKDEEEEEKRDNADNAVSI
jgi:hypothetical protein